MQPFAEPVCFWNATCRDPMSKSKASSAGNRLPNQSPAGIDLSQLRANLRLSPAERLSRMVAWTVWIQSNRGIARPRAQK